MFSGESCTFVALRELVLGCLLASLKLLILTPAERESFNGL